MAAPGALPETAGFSRDFALLQRLLVIVGERR